MRPHALRRALVSAGALGLVLLGLSLVVSREPATPTPAASPTAQREAVPPAAVATRAPVAAPTPTPPAATVARDLTADEKIGGHTLARHVGRTDAQLAERLRLEPGISAASTYTDATIAARVVGEALVRSKKQLDTWLARRGPRPNLVLNYQTTGPPIGRSLGRGERSVRACRQALVVLRWDDGPRRWFVLTSYPEAG